MKITYPNPKLLFHGTIFDIIEVEGVKEGKKFKRQVVDHPGAVVIMAIMEDNKILMIRNRRESVGQVLWELPAGTVEKGEEPLTTAKRELQEETGYLAKEVRFLFRFFSTPGFCNEILYAYVAQNLSYIGQNLQGTESIEVAPMSLQEIHSMIQQGIICDAKTICLLLYYIQFENAKR
jgi:ADP-ribose pyrophosphatase